MLLRTLGGLWLEDSDFSRPKPLLLLAYLALEGTKPRHYLADLFFMEASDRRNSLTKALGLLRQEVPGVIEVDNKKVWATVSCDAAELLNLTDSKQFEKCLALYQGAFAADYDLELTEELQDWLYGTREILAAKARQAFLMLGETEASKGHFSQAALLAEKAYRLKEAAELEPDDFGRLYNLLHAGGSPLAAEVRKDAEGFEIPLELSREEAKAQLSESVEITHDIPNNLPPPKTSFIGRDQELIEIAQQLAKKDCRLLTLHGMGGIGKSRLAIQAAYDQLKSKQFNDGVYFVTLDALTSAELIPSSIAEALGLELQGQEDTLTQVKRFMGKKHILLLLDNYEHLMAGATLTSNLLETCSNLKLLVTSRERLNVEEEWVLTLDGLAVPTLAELSEAERFDALNLFVQRAKRAMLEFSLSQETLPHALKICQLVEGSPLGIELAAVWVKTLPVAEIAKEIESNLSILEAPTKNIAERHQSIRAAFEHSWKLLTDKEQEVLRKLSVFVGGFRREAAADVAGATLPILASLVDKSLLRVSENGRYDRHVLLYQFAQRKLAEKSKEKADAETKHRLYFFNFLEANPLWSTNDVSVLLSMDEEIENIKTAWISAITMHELSELKYPEDLVSYFDRRGKYQQGVELYRAAIESLNQKQTKHPDLLASLLIDQSWLLIKSGRWEDAQRSSQQSLELAQSSNAQKQMMKALNILGNIANHEDEYEKAISYMQKAYELAKILNDFSRKIRYQGNLAALLENVGQYQHAKEQHEQILQLNLEKGYTPGVIQTLNNLGVLHRNLGEWHQAQTYYQEGLNRARKTGEIETLPSLLLGLAITAFQQGDTERAKVFCSQALDYRGEENNGDIEAVVLMVLGYTEISNGNFMKARELLKQGLQKAESDYSHSTILILEICIAYAELERQTGNFTRAFELLNVIDNQPQLPVWLKKQLEVKLLQTQNLITITPSNYTPIQKSLDDVLTEIIIEGATKDKSQHATTQVSL